MKQLSRNTIQEKDYIAGLGKGMAILECFDSERQRLSATMAAERTGITRAAARRHLLTLQHLGYLESDGQYYVLTPKILKFSSAYLSGSALAKIAQPLLNLLALQTGHTYSLMVLDGLEAITIARSFTSENSQKTQRIKPYGVNLGHRLPAYATSAGKVLLAYLSTNEIISLIEKHPLKSFTKNTVTNTDSLLQELAQIKAQQWSYVKEEHEHGVHAIAVPVISTTGNILASLNMVTSIQNATATYMQNDILPFLQNVASEIRLVL